VAAAERLYSRALFEAAQERGRLEPVREELGDFVASVHEVPELQALLVDPKLEPETKVRALEGLLGESDELVRNFLLVVTERGRGGELTEIYREFERLVAAESGQLDVVLTTAIELSDAEAAEIVTQIERASGRRVEATRRVDPSLVGGIILEVGSRRLDASIRNRLDRLRQELVTGGTR